MRCDHFQKTLSSFYGGLRCLLGLMGAWGVSHDTLASTGANRSHGGQSLSPHESQIVLGKINDYLQNLQTMTAVFKQTDPSGRKSEGIFYLWRPGRMRLEYLPPSPDLLVADGETIYHINRASKEVSSADIASTPAYLLLKQRVDFAKDARVLSLQTRGNLIRVILAPREAFQEGSIALIFTQNPLQLKEWTLADDEGKKTRVALSQVKTGVSLPNDLFRVQ